MKTLSELQKAVENMHGCKARYIGAVPVNETFKGNPVWQGVVDVFALTGHPKAKRCYAWSHLEGQRDERTRFFAVLELPPVDSARKASI
jgi:hypothetical protein